MLRSSVSSRIPWHSEFSWEVRRWKTLSECELFEAPSSILNSVLHLTAVHHFNMNRKETKVKALSERRFGSIIFILRMVGIPCKMKKLSTIYALYMITVIICATTTYLGMCADVYVHCEDLGRTMTTMRALFPFTNFMWIFSNCR